MSNDLNDIDGENQERSSLLGALNDELQADQQEDLTDDFKKDAEEGLRLISDERTAAIVSQLNTTLSQKLKKSKMRRAHRYQLKPDIYIVVITVLLLIILSCIVLNKIH